MWAVVQKSALLAVAVLMLAGGSAGAATMEMEVKVPFPFVVHGQMLPAGRYLVERESDASVILIRGEHGNNAGMFVMTTLAGGDDPAGGKPALTFTRHETQYRLADIWDADGHGRKIAGS